MVKGDDEHENEYIDDPEKTGKKGSSQNIYSFNV
jgi:hypothetical protein